MNILGLRGKLSNGDLFELAWCLRSFEKKNHLTSVKQYLDDSLFFRDRAIFIAALEYMIEEGAACFKERRVGLVKHLKVGYKDVKERSYET